MALPDLLARIARVREAVAAGEVADGVNVLRRLEETEELAASRLGAVSGYLRVGKQGKNMEWLAGLEGQIGLQSGRFANTPLAYVARLKSGIDSSYLAANPQLVTTSSVGSLYSKIDLASATTPVSFKVVAGHGTEGLGLTNGMSTVELTGIRSMGDQTTVIFSPSDRTLTVIGQSVGHPVEVGIRRGEVVKIGRGESKTFHLADGDEQCLIGIDQRVVYLSLPRNRKLSIVTGEAVVNTNFKPRSPFADENPPRPDGPEFQTEALPDLDEPGPTRQIIIRRDDGTIVSTGGKVD